MVSPHKIRYNNISSNELNILDLIMEVAFDTDSGETSTYLNREGVVSETYDGRRKYVARYKYNESFSPKFTFLKKNFGDFSQDEVRQVLKWLTSKDTTAVIDVYYDHADDSEMVDWSVIGGWTEISTYKLGNNRTVGIVATFESITPFALSSLKTITKTISNPADNKITINIDTDDNKPVYPRVTIKHNGSVVRIPDGTVLTTTSDMVEDTVYYNGTTWYWKSDKPGRCTALKTPAYTGWTTVTVTSSADIKYADKTIYLLSGVYYWLDPYYFKSSSTNPSLVTTSVKFTNRHTDFLNQSKVLTPTIVKNNNSTETIVLDGANRVVSSSSVNRIFDTDFVNWNWLPLLDGKNEITVEGNCTVTLEWREVRKVGEF